MRIILLVVVVLSAPQALLAQSDYYERELEREQERSMDLEYELMMEKQKRYDDRMARQLCGYGKPLRNSLGDNCEFLMGGD